MALFYFNESIEVCAKKKNIRTSRSLDEYDFSNSKNINCLRSKTVYTTVLVNFSTTNIISFRVFTEIGEENYYELVRRIVQIMGGGRVWILASVISD